MREAGPGRGRREQTGEEEEQVREITSRQEQAETGRSRPGRSRSRQEEARAGRSS